MSPDGKLLISGSADESIKILDIPNRQEIHHFKEAHKGFSLVIHIFLNISKIQ